MRRARGAVIGEETAWRRSGLEREHLLKCSRHTRSCFPCLPAHGHHGWPEDAHQHLETAERHQLHLAVKGDAAYAAGWEPPGRWGQLGGSVGLGKGRGCGCCSSAARLAREKPARHAWVPPAPRSDRRPPAAAEASRLVLSGMCGCRHAQRRAGCWLATGRGTHFLVEAVVGVDWWYMTGTNSIAADSANTACM